MTVIAPYGTWESPIGAADVAGAKLLLAHPDVVGDEVWWQEGRPAEGGRVVVAACGPDGRVRDLLPPPWNARTRVHEYGGRSYLPVPRPDGGVDLVFAEFTDQRLYRLDLRAAVGAPTPLTPAGGGFRYADMVVSPDGGEVWCVREAVDGRRVSRAIVAVPLDGTAAHAGEAVRVLVTGADFFAFPTPSPDGKALAWVCWDHPRMPWDGTELRVGPATGGTVDDATLVMGGPGESVLAPWWCGSDALYAVSDVSGWWNLYRVRPGEPAEPLCPREEEFAAPLWRLGDRPFGVLGDGRLAVLHGVGALRLGVIEPATGSLTDLDLPFTAVNGGVAVSDRWLAAVAGSPQLPWSVVRASVNGGHVVLRPATTRTPDPGYLPVPRRVRLPVGRDGAEVHALVYAPASPTARAPAGERPPFIVWVHGGPTSNAQPVFDLEKAYFTSRGIGVVDVDYGGSSGYGRAYRERLRGRWGVVDVADAIGVAVALAESGEADGARLGIRGGSAGGWTALAAVTSAVTGTDAGPGRRPVFAAAVSYFGVTDLRLLAATTHDFESRYLDGLIGPLPEAEDRYLARSPLGHVSAGTCPVLLLQGLDDPVVPPDQSEAFARDLAAHGVPHTYVTFAGEAHGFRRAETIIAALEAELSFYGRVMGFVPPGVAPVELV